MALAVLQARMSSSRLPGKVMRPLDGAPMIQRQIERLRRARRLSRMVVATSTDPSDDVLAAFVDDLGVGVWRGPLQDVLARFQGAIQAFGPVETVVRLTADCPFADPEVIDLCLARHAEGGFDGVHNSPGWTFPKGLDVEVWRAEAIAAAAREAVDPYEREHVTPFLYRRPERFRVGLVTRDPPERWRWTVDTAEDYAFAAAVYADLHPRDPAFTSADVLAWQAAHPGRALPHHPEAG